MCCRSSWVTSCYSVTSCAWFWLPPTCSWPSWPCAGMPFAIFATAYLRNLSEKTTMNKRNEDFQFLVLNVKSILMDVLSFVSRGTLIASCH